ncbi:hypothetical protein F2Q70_00007584 [Brassica cretica]|uniref:Response regulatory domain-containing protein n=1 Tax=Brassica cretica TaxID=69181 RepID=A0A8S9JGP4_BRACR|nr:hypothetical protein F2Q68_00000628 [Brassica cretica]KAF2612978.1 hypothetical protein F2Q70_00007584 [Brassica cretica]
MRIAAADWKFHVLVVDDSLFDWKLIERLLQKNSCQVTTVDSGYKALEFLGLRQGIESNDSIALSSSPQEVEVNFTITDYCMSGITGCDLLKKVKCPQLSSGHPRLLVIQLNPSSMIHS